MPGARRICDVQNQDGAADRVAALGGECRRCLHGVNERTLWAFSEWILDGRAAQRVPDPRTLTFVSSRSYLHPVCILLRERRECIAAPESASDGDTRPKIGSRVTCSANHAMIVRRPGRAHDLRRSRSARIRDSRVVDRGSSVRHRSVCSIRRNAPSGRISMRCEDRRFLKLEPPAAIDALPALKTTTVKCHRPRAVLVQLSTVAMLVS